VTNCNNARWKLEKKLMYWNS